MQLASVNRRLVNRIRSEQVEQSLQTTDPADTRAVLIGDALLYAALGIAPWHWQVSVVAD